MSDGTENELNEMDGADVADEEVDEDVQADIEAELLEGSILFCMKELFCVMVLFLRVSYSLLMDE